MCGTKQAGTGTEGRWKADSGVQRTQIQVLALWLGQSDPCFSSRILMYKMGRKAPASPLVVLMKRDWCACFIFGEFTYRYIHNLRRCTKPSPCSKEASTFPKRKSWWCWVEKDTKQKRVCSRQRGNTGNPSTAQLVTLVFIRPGCSGSGKVMYTHVCSAVLTTPEVSKDFTKAILPSEGCVARLFIEGSSCQGGKGLALVL